MNNYGDNKLGTATILPGRKQRVFLDEYGYGNACEFDVFIKTEDQQIDEERKDLCLDNKIVFGGARTEPPAQPPGASASDMPVAAAVLPAPPPVADCAECQPLTVRTGPPNARVQITNIGPPYESGIELPPGEYDIRVTADGFEMVERTLRHDDKPTDVWIGLPFRDCPICPRMIELPTGKYTMGTSQGEDRYTNEGPAHEVEIGSSLAVGVFEVSFEEWDACVDDGGCMRNLRDEGRGRGPKPVVNATVADAKEYTGWLAARFGRPYRLLSEAEWEYAARAGTSGARYWGSRREDQCAHENGADVSAQQQYSDWTIIGCSDGYVHAAPNDEERFRANPWGLHHMLGNVSEWTADCWHNNYVGAPRDGSAWRANCHDRHVVRGGSWASKPRSVRAPTRLSYDPTEGAPDVGFRVAVEITR